MLQDAIEIFKKEYDKHGDSLILDSYIPSDGTYVIVIPKGDGFKVDEIVDIKFNKETKNIDRSISQYIDFICFADYNSKLIDMNKAILSSSGKVIQGNNYLSFIIKKESLTNGKLNNEIIDNYYSILENPLLKYTKPKAKDLYELTEKSVGKVDKERLKRIKEWIKNNLFSLIKDNSGKDYLKIFFYFPEEEYKNEGKRYLIPNIYNNNDSNKIIDNEICGLPNNNMGLNSKKPYLENKTRKVNVPYLINQEEVLYQKRFFDYLMNQVSIGRFNIYLGDKIISLSNNENLDKKFTGVFLRIKKGKEVEIHDYDIISNYNPKLIKIFEYKNILCMDYDDLKGKYGIVKTLSEMQVLVNQVMFSGFLVSNYFTEQKELPDRVSKDNNLKENLLICRTALFNWFYKGNNKNIWMLLNKAFLSLVKGSIAKDYKTKAADQFNLRMSLKEYFEGGEEMADIIFDTKEGLREKISDKKTQQIKSDREYFFAVGQLVSYFISKSKGKKKPLSLANPFINAKKDSIIKEKLKALYKKYNYDIESYSYKFKNLYAMIMAYEIEEKVDENMIIAGYLHSNLLYEKDEKNEGGKNNE